MKYKEIDRDLLIRKRRIAFELGESNLPKYAKKIIERVLDSEELTPTFSETEIRANEMVRMFEPYDVESIEELIQNVRAKAIEESIEQIKCFNPNTAEEAKGLQEAINIMSRLKGVWND